MRQIKGRKYTRSSAKTPSGRKPPFIPYSKHIKQIFELYMKRVFFEYFYLREDESTMTHGLSAFFNTTTRRVYFAVATESFTMPGKTWLRPESPNILQKGLWSGKRMVKPGDKMVVREDETMPNRVEIEYQDLIFVLTQAEYAFVEERLKAIA